MPKIVINEYDLTKAGTSEYQNFSVVVPGFVSANYNEAVFDENDVYECTTQKDFENNVGKVAAEIVTTTTNTAAVAPSISCIIKYDPDRFETDFTVVPATDNTPITYVYKKHDEFSDAFAALMEGNEPEETDWDTELSEVPAEFGVYYAVSNTSGIVGTLRDEINHYQAASAGDSGAAAVPTVTGRTMSINETSTPSYNTYYIIEDGDAQGKPGKYTEERITHYGNQMAYELLGLGYTVLYKKIPYLKELPAGDANYETVTDSVTGTEYKRLKAENSALNVLSDADFWNCLRDKSTYDFRYVVTGMITGNDGANAQIKALAAHDNEILLDDATIDDGRGDCIALIDIDSTAYAGKTQIAAIPLIAKEAAKWESSYCAVFAPYVRYIMPDDPDYNNNNLFPAAFHYLACAMYSKNKNFNEWYANAGYTRGVSKYTIESTGCKLGEMAVQSLEPRFMLKVGQEKKVDDAGSAVTPTEYVAINTTVAVNLIIKIKDAYYLWGNRTCKKLGTRNAADGDLVAQHFLNIRQLSTTIKKQVYTTCRRLTFDPNSDKLWLDFQSLIRPTLDLMRGDNGIRDYMFVKDTTDRKALLKAKIRIVPIEAIEDFDIGIYLEDSLTDVSVTEG